MMQSYFFGPTAMDSPYVQGFYVCNPWLYALCKDNLVLYLLSLKRPLLKVDDGWSSSGPSEMDKNATTAMGMSAADIQAM